jgi:uncharacterized DUF497 family protein
MKAEQDPEIDRWLQEFWEGGLEWDDANRRKLTHGVTEEEIEEVFSNRFVVVGRVVPPRGSHWPPEKRYALFGKTNSSRILTVIWTTRGNSIRPISMRSSVNAEKKQFAEKISQGNG